jgi:hypothetical protein
MNSPEHDPAPEVEEGPTTDEALAATKAAILDFLRVQRPKDIFYLGQLEVLFEERRFLKTPWGMRAPFHWITGKALVQLEKEGRIASDRDPQQTGSLNAMRFFHSKSHRDWRMQAREIHDLMEEMSRPNFNHAVGHVAEILFDSALAGADFTVAARDTNEWNGVKWTKTNENLDRIYVHRDGTAYGAEIKNTLPYIGSAEFESKLNMCSFLRVRPLFIARKMPEVYVQRVARRGGFALLYRQQLYPFGFEDLADRVRARLELPVACLRAVPEGEIRRFTKWQEKARSIVDPGGNPQDGPVSG